MKIITPLKREMFEDIANLSMSVFNLGSLPPLWLLLQEQHASYMVTTSRLKTVVFYVGPG